MKKINILIIIFIVFALIIFFIELKKSPINNTVNIFNIPLKIDEWIGKEIPADEYVKEILETKSVLLRTYSDGRDDIMLTIVYYKDSRVAFHLPEGCLSGQGSKLFSRNEEKIDIVGEESFPSTELITKTNNNIQVILYYFETGKFRTSNYFLFRLQMMKNKFMGKNNSGALVKFSKSGTTDVKDDVLILKRFMNKVVPILPEYLI